MNHDPGVNWLWASGMGVMNVADLTSRTGTRLLDLKTSFVAGNRQFSAILLNNSNAATTRVGQLLRSLTDAEPGLYLKRVGGAVEANLQETFPFNPASSIKILVAVDLLLHIDRSHGALSLNSTAKYFALNADSSCPPGEGSAQKQTLGTLLNWMLENSDNAATRSLIDLMGGLSAVDASARRLGMTNTQLNVYPGCNITNRTSLADVGKLYEGIADETLLDARQRRVLYASMPADAGDFSGTRGSALSIIDEEASNLGLSLSAVDAFKQAFDVHYKAGSDTWCTPDCLDYLAIAGVAEIPDCDHHLRTRKSYVFGLFTHGGSNGTAWSAFFTGQAEPLREPIRAALSGWSTCSR